ncbi:putative NADP(+)-dependent dehydrogenase [Acrodontium crateriforme]|uniref:NADP(+)-dependent dehydrogenase n=1 Tax=Acrodontium crateriforme TaxID=150365 RepID=A0AAQ3MBS2_9PEZI|nr:putative NADP(+)-dependent dehydrogenase [Acrodontium crateriforme]
MLSSISHFPRPTKTYHAKSYPRIAPKNVGFDGRGKTIFITAGATGVGYATARAFCETGASRIIIVSRSSGPQEKAKQELGAAYPSTEVVCYRVSVTDHVRINEVVREVGAIDVLVLSAAASDNQFDDASKTKVVEVENVYLTNVVASFNLVQTYLNTPAPARKTVLNLSSLSAHATVPNQVGYGPSKAAVTQMMQHFAAEQTSGNVKIISYHPGALYTEAVETMGIPKDVLEWEDIDLPAHFALWLSGPESDFLHGRFVWAAWDVDELIELKEKVAKDPRFLTIGLIQ